MSNLTSPTLLPLPPNIQTLTAPLLYGEIFSAYLYGVLSVQVYLYFITFPADILYIKLLVYGVFALDTASTIMCLLDVYHWFAVGFGSIAALNDIQLSGFDTPMLDAVIAAIVQTFYCYRIWKIEKKALPVSILVFLISLAEVVAGIYGATIAVKAKTFSNAAEITRPAIYIIYIGAAVADVLIALTMIFLLQRSRSRVHENTRYKVSKIINLTAETNLFSTVLALLSVILLVACPNTNYFTCPSLMLGKVYSNSLLLLLNNRHYLNSSQGGNEYSTVSSNSSSTQMSRLKRSAKGPSRETTMRLQDMSTAVDPNTTTDLNGNKVDYEAWPQK